MTLPTEAQQTASLLEAKDVTIAELRKELAERDLWADFTPHSVQHTTLPPVAVALAGVALGIAATLVVGAVL